MAGAEAGDGGGLAVVLSVSALRRAGALVPGKRMGGLWGWTYEEDERPHAIVGYEADLTEPDDPWLRLRYDVNDERVECMVRLVSTRPNYGGHRWWFVCPLMGRRAAKLYLPPRARLFGSREAYGLTYAFCQASGSPLIASIAADVGASVPRVRGAMRRLGFLRRETADRRAHHGGAVVGAFWAARIKLRRWNGMTFYAIAHPRKMGDN